jgi:Superinfection immunity protein
MNETGLVLFAVVAGVYSLPALIAGARQHHQRMAISILTLLAGWTAVGWLIALVWACTEVRLTEAVQRDATP